MKSIQLMDGIASPLNEERGQLLKEFPEQSIAIDAIIEEAKRKFAGKSFEYDGLAAVCSEIDQFDSLKNIDPKIADAVRCCRQRLLAIVVNMLKGQPEFSTFSREYVERCLADLYDKKLRDGLERYSDKRDIVETLLRYEKMGLEQALSMFCRKEFATKLDLLPLEEWHRNCNDPQQRWPEPSEIEKWSMDYYQEHFVPYFESLSERLAPSLTLCPEPGTLTRQEVIDAIDTVRQDVDFRSIPLAPGTPHNQINAYWNDAILMTRALIIRECPEILRSKEVIRTMKDTMKRGGATADPDPVRKNVSVFTFKKILQIFDNLENKIEPGLTQRYVEGTRRQPNAPEFLDFSEARKQYMHASIDLLRRIEALTKVPGLSAEKKQLMQKALQNLDHALQNIQWVCLPDMKNIPRELINPQKGKLCVGVLTKESAGAMDKGLVATVTVSPRSLVLKPAAIDVQWMKALLAPELLQRCFSIESLQTTESDAVEHSVEARALAVLSMTGNVNYHSWLCSHGLDTSKKILQAFEQGNPVIVDFIRFMNDHTITGEPASLDEATERARAIFSVVLWNAPKSAEDDGNVAMDLNQEGCEVFARQWINHLQEERSQVKPSIRKTELDALLSRVTGGPVGQKLEDQRVQQMSSLSLSSVEQKKLQRFGTELIEVSKRSFALLPDIITDWSQIQTLFDATTKAEIAFGQQQTSAQAKRACAITQETSSLRRRLFEQEILKHYALKEISIPTTSSETKEQNKLSRAAILIRFKDSFSKSWNQAEAMLSKKVPMRKSIGAPMTDYTKMFNDYCPDPVTFISSLEEMINKMRLKNKTHELTMPAAERPHAKEWAEILATGIDACITAFCADIPEKDVDPASLSLRNNITVKGKEFTARIPCGDLLRSLLDTVSNVERTMRERYRDKKTVIQEILASLQEMQDHLKSVNDAYPQGLNELGFYALESICTKDNDNAPIKNATARTDFLTTLKSEFAPVFVVWNRVMDDVHAPQGTPEEVRLPEEEESLKRVDVVKYLIHASHRADAFCGVTSNADFDEILRGQLQELGPAIIAHISDLDEISGYVLGRCQAIEWFTNRKLHRHVNMMEFERSIEDIQRRLPDGVNVQNPLRNFPNRKDSESGQEKSVYQQKLVNRFRASKVKALAVVPADAKQDMERFFMQAEKSITTFLQRWCPGKIAGPEMMAVAGFCAEIIFTSRSWTKKTSQQQLDVFADILEKEFLLFADEHPAYPIATISPPVPFEKPKENLVPVYWSDYVAKVAQDQFRSFIQQCDNLSFTIADESQLLHLRDRIYDVYSTMSRTLQSKVVDACRKQLPDLSDSEPPSELLYDAVIEGILDNVSALPPEVPENVRSAFNNAMQNEIDKFFKERNPVDVIIAGDAGLWNPSKDPKADLELALRMHLPPPESREQIFRRGQSAIRDAYAAAMIDLLVNAVAKSGKETVTTTDGLVFASLSRADFSWEWIEAIPRELTQIIDKGTAESSKEEDPEAYFAKNFTGPRTQIFLARAGSAVEKILLSLGVKQEICTAVRSAVPDLSSPLEKKKETTGVREKAHRTLFTNRSTAPLFQREKQLIGRFCRIVLTKGQNTEAQLRPRGEQLEEIAAQCNEVCHAGEKCRTAENLWPHLIAIGNEELEKKGDATPTGLLSELPVAEHLRGLQSLVLENQQWIDTLPTASRARNAIGQLVEIFDWHQQSSDYLQQSVILGTDAGPSGEAVINARKVAEVRKSEVITVVKNEKGGDKLELEGPKLRAIFRSLKALEQASGSGSGFSAPAMIEDETKEYLAMARELEQLQASVSSGLPVVDVGALEGDADQQEQYETSLRAQEPFLSELPKQASQLLGRFRQVISALQMAAEASAQRLVEAEASVHSATTTLTDATRMRGTPTAILDELSKRLAAAQEAHEAAKILARDFPFEEWKASVERLQSQCFAVVMETLPAGSVLPGSVAIFIDVSSPEAIGDSWMALEQEMKLLNGTCEDIVLTRAELQALTGGAPERVAAMKDVKKKSRQRQKDLVRIEELKRKLAVIRKAILPDQPS